MPFGNAFSPPSACCPLRTSLQIPLPRRPPLLMLLAAMPSRIAFPLFPIASQTHASPILRPLRPQDLLPRDVFGLIQFLVPAASTPSRRYLCLTRTDH